MASSTLRDKSLHLLPTAIFTAWQSQAITCQKQSPTSFRLPRQLLRYSHICSPIPRLPLVTVCLLSTRGGGASLAPSLSLPVLLTPGTVQQYAFN